MTLFCEIFKTRRIFIGLFWQYISIADNDILLILLKFNLFRIGNAIVLYESMHSDV